jgi:signal transduction histidine kinase
MAGIWLYHERNTGLGANLTQLGNFGIILAANYTANLIVFHERFVSATSFATGTSLLMYVVVATSVFVFVAFNVAFYLQGRKRLVMMPLLLALGILALTDYTASLALVSGTYTSNAMLNWGYLWVFVLAYWAAFEQDQLRGISGPPPTAEDLMRRARQLETLLPPVAIVVVVTVALTFRDNLTPDLAPFAAVGLLLFVASLALRDWWNRRVEVALLEQAERGESRLLLEKNRELAEANRELLEEMQARMRIQEELRHSQKMEAVGHLTGGVAHDFNNLLAVILGNLELLEQHLDAESQEFALTKEATRAAARGAALTQRLLAFSRKQQLAPRPLDVRALLEEMRSLLESTLSEAIRLEIPTREDLWLCMADSVQLENAILNLVINARDAVGSGGRIVVEATNLSLDDTQTAAYSDAQAGSYVAISVRDSGTGIPAEILPRIFDPFFTTKEVGEGSGLGLSMVYGFARQSGGFVSLQSEVGLGTEIQICLPRVEVQQERRVTGHSDVVVRGGGESVLLVEDDPTVRKLFASTLEGLGYRVIQAEDGGEALAILREDEPVDVILSDVVLPGTYSGPDLIREVGRRRPGVKPLLMSGYASGTFDRSESMLDGVRLLHKPFKKGELARVMRAVIDGA